jgi:DNA-directed RNA polymerase I, II, and III subunit RPABC2
MSVASSNMKEQQPGNIAATGDEQHRQCSGWTVPFLTKFERTSILSLRIQMLENGALPLVPAQGATSLAAVAEAELNQGKLPFVVERKLPNNQVARLRVNDLLRAESQ